MNKKNKLRHWSYLPPPLATIIDDRFISNNASQFDWGLITDKCIK